MKHFETSVLNSQGYNSLCGISNQLLGDLCNSKRPIFYIYHTLTNHLAPSKQAYYKFYYNKRKKMIFTGFVVYSTQKLPLKHCGSGGF